MSEEATWFVRRRDPAQARSTDAQFKAWAEADPRNAVRYGQCELMWERTGELEADEDIAKWLDESDRAAKSSSKSRHRWINGFNRARSTLSGPVLIIFA